MTFFRFYDWKYHTLQKIYLWSLCTLLLLSLENVFYPHAKMMLWNFEITKAVLWHHETVKTAHVTTLVLQPPELVLQQGPRGSRDGGRKWLLCFFERRLAEGQAGFCCGPDFLQSLLSVHSMFEWLYREIAFIVSTQENQKQKHLQHSVWRQCSQKHWGNDLPARIKVSTMCSSFALLF